jgi:hypothetical protein
MNIVVAWDSGPFGNMSRRCTALHDAVAVLKPWPAGQQMQSSNSGLLLEVQLRDMHVTGVTELPLQGMSSSVLLAPIGNEGLCASAS